MPRFAILAGLMAVGVAAHADHATVGFKYVGCVEADPATFGANINFLKAFSADECQSACDSKANYAALGTGCHCDDPSSNVPVKYEVIDESKCSVLCIDGNQDAGYCGGPPCPESGKHRYNLYRRASVVEGDEECEEEATAAPVINTKFIVPEVSTTIKTITSCPPEVTDCPITHPTGNPHEAIPPVNTKLPASFAEPGIPACPEKCGPPCPPEGCPPCPPEGCLLPCPPGCPVTPPEPPVCPGGPDCYTEIPTPPVCPPEGCPESAAGPGTPPVQPTTGPTAGSEPVIVSEGSHHQSGVFALLTAVAMALAISLS